jgi:biopolymer transport protein ExbB
MRTIVLAGGISRALMATAIGLGIGLVAMFFYAIYRVRVQGLVNILETSVTELVVVAVRHLDAPVDAGAEAEPAAPADKPARGEKA